MLIIVWFLAMELGSDMDHMPLRHWNTKTGLPQNDVNAIVQDENGYLYWGTQEGLVRFDGHSIKTYTRFNTSDFPINYIYCMELGPENTIWIGTRFGLFSFKNQKFDLYPQLKDQQILDLQWFKGSLIVLTANRVYRLENLKMTILHEGNGLTQVVADQSGDIWIAGSQLTQLKADGSVQVHNKKPDYLFVFQEKVWICQGSNIFNIENGPTFTFPAGLQVRAATQHQDTFLLGTNQGLFIFDADGNMSQGLDSKSILSLFSDFEGHIWFGEHGNGIFQIRDSPIRNYTESHGLPKNYTTAIVQNTKGDIFVATSGGVCKINQNGEITKLGTTQNQPAITTIYLDRSENLYGNVFNKNLMIYENGSWQDVRDYRGDPYTNVRCMIEDQKGDLWLTSDHQGIINLKDQGRTRWNFDQRTNYIFDIALRSKGGFWAVGERGLFIIQDGEIKEVPGVENLPYACLGVFEDDTGGLWFTRELSGINYLKNGKLYQADIAQGLPYDTNFNLRLDSNDRFWTGNNQGMFSVAKQELLDLFDGKLEKIQCQSFKQSDGLVSGECNLTGNSSLLLASDGWAYFPTVAGLVKIQANPDHKKQPHLVPIIEDLTVNGSQLHVSEGMVIGPDIKRLDFRFTAPTMDRGELTQFQFKMAGLDESWSSLSTDRHATYTYLPPGAYQFMVKAISHQGISSIHAASINLIIKPSLLQNKAFQIAFWSTIILLFSAIPIFRNIIYRKRKKRLQQLVNERTQDLIEANKSLMKTQNQLIHAAHEAGMAEIAIDVLHNLGNVLNSLSVEAELLQQRIKQLVPPTAKRILGLLPQDPDLQKTYLLSSEGENWLRGLNLIVQTFPNRQEDLASHIDEVQRYIDKVRETVAAQQKHIKRGRIVEHVDINHIIHSSFNMHMPEVNKEGVSFDLRIEETIQSEMGKMTQIINTLIKNALEAVEHIDEPKIHIQSFLENGNLNLCIEDNGIGIDPKQMEKIFQQGFTTKPDAFGTGLHYASLLAKSLGGHIEAFSAGQGKGARFCFTMPLENESENFEKSA